MKKEILLVATAASLIGLNSMAHAGTCGSKKSAHKASGKTACTATTAKDNTCGVSLDIVETAVKAGSFNTLVAAVKAAGLAEVLKGDGPFTVFAPTDEAFAKLPKGTVESLLKPENKDKLQGILKYHVVSGKVTSKDVVSLDSAKTVQGQKLSIDVDGKAVKVDGANVVKVDIETSNGVIHVIDTVILPKES